MNNSKSYIEDSRITPFVAKLTLGAGGGFFLDGYILVIIGAALVQLGPHLNLNTGWTGLIGAASLLGILFGSSGFGYVTDRIGRKDLFILNVIAVAILSILQVLVANPVQLVIFRFFLGVCVGADYTIGTPLLSEFAPKKHRGLLLGLMQVTWFVGACSANVVGYFLIDAQNGWKWMLASAAIPAFLLIMIRFGTPESPFWLANKGKIDEANKVLKRVYGPETDINDLELGNQKENVHKTSYKKLFEPGYFSRLIFCGGFYLCVVIPVFGIYTFGPKILEAFNLAHGKQAMLGDMSLSIVFMFGCIIGLWLIEKLGRRTLSIWGFAVAAIGLLILGIFPNASITVILIGFSIYAIASGIPNDLTTIYPSELFPTEIRAFGVGVSTAISRIGAFLGTFALPSVLAMFGVGATMLIMAGITVLGLALSVALAPETKGQSLAEASSVSLKK